MRLIPIFSMVVFVAVFAAIYGYNLQATEKVSFQPPYAFQPEDLQGEVLSLVFVFVFSLLFFGSATPLALGIEAAKFASLYSTGAVGQFYLALALPICLVGLSASYLGHGLWVDYQGKGLWRDYARKSTVYLMAGLALWALIYFGRQYVTI